MADIIQEKILEYTGHIASVTEYLLEQAVCDIGPENWDRYVQFGAKFDARKPHLLHTVIDDSKLPTAKTLSTLDVQSFGKTAIQVLYTKHCFSQDKENAYNINLKVTYNGYDSKAWKQIRSVSCFIDCPLSAEKLNFSGEYEEGKGMAFWAKIPVIGSVQGENQPTDCRDQNVINFFEKRDHLGQFGKKMTDSDDMYNMNLKNCPQDLNLSAFAFYMALSAWMPFKTMQKMTPEAIAKNPPVTSPLSNKGLFQIFLFGQEAGGGFSD